METKNKKVLLIEDEEIIVNLLTKELLRAGYNVSDARDGETGLQKIESFQPDIVLLDLLLPIKSGFDVINALKASGMLAKIPVIVISNSGQPSEIENLLTLGVQEVLTKVNFNPTDVVEKVGHYLEARAEISETKEPEVVPAIEEIPTEIPRETSNKKKVLIVEDDPFIGDLVVQGFKKYFDVHRVLNAAEADTLLQNEDVDAIVLDIILPGKDGITYLKELRQKEKYAHLPIVLATNLGQEEEVDAGMQAGADDYVIKANHLPEEIAKRVLAIIEKKG